MPTEQITVCASCGRPACDGAMWKTVKIMEGTVEINLKTIPKQNLQPRCTYESMAPRYRKTMLTRKIGDEVEIDRSNWTSLLPGKRGEPSKDGVVEILQKVEA